MKIKTDFVTNSSSTMYIIYLPDDFQIDEEEALVQMKHHDIIDHFSKDLDPPMDPEDYFLTELAVAIDNLRTSGELWMNDIDSAVFFVLVDVIPGNLIIKAIECSEGYYSIHAIKPEDLKPHYMAETLKSLEVKGNKNDEKK